MLEINQSISVIVVLHKPPITEIHYKDQKTNTTTTIWTIWQQRKVDSKSEVLVTTGFGCAHIVVDLSPGSSATVTDM